MRLAKQDIVTHAAAAGAEREGREGGGYVRGRRRRRGGIAEGEREIHYHDNGFSDWLTCRCWPAMPAACLPGKGGRGLEGKGERDKALFLPFHRSFATASHVAPRRPLCGLARSSGSPWRCTNWVHNYVLQQPR